ncbi:UNVERIFIED_CONTAM: hypothetical protein GTU68_024348, partial [Idotea baltica]|nr:hypothetical protein [Idotea baltica]
LQALHASKQQKQRLKSLERFTRDEVAVLLATDVAARGLDIPGVDHIIHYEVPKTAESYVHRSGRTARASHEGLSVLLISSTEVGKYRQLCATLNRASDLPSFPIQAAEFKRLEKIVQMARDIEKMEFDCSKKQTNEAWLIKMSEEAGLDVG